MQFLQAAIGRCAAILLLGADFAMLALGAIGNAANARLKAVVGVDAAIHRFRPGSTTATCALKV